MTPPAAEHLLETFRRFAQVCEDWYLPASQLVMERTCDRAGLDPTEELRVEAERLLRAACLDDDLKRAEILADAERWWSA